MAASWKYVICDLDGGNTTDVTNVYDRKLAFPLNRLPTASGRVRLDHPLIDRLQTGDQILKAYRSKDPTDLVTNPYTLRFLGPLLTGEEAGGGSAESDQVQFNAVGGFYYLQGRQLGNKGATWQYGSQVAAANQPRTGLKSRADIAKEIVNEVNKDGYTGITPMTTIPVMPADAAYGPVTNTPASEAILDLCASAAAGGFDWEVTPQDFVAAPAGAVAIKGGAGSSLFTMKRIGTLNMYYTQKGSTLSNVVFEFGTQRPQVSSYKRATSKEDLITKGYINPPGWPSSGAVDQLPKSAIAQDAALLKRGLIEGLIPTEQTDPALRQLLVNKNVTVRQDYRYLVTFTLAQNATPSPFIDYNTGDFVRGRSVVNGIVRFDAFFRVYGFTVNLDNAGNEVVELELQEPV